MDDLHWLLLCGSMLLHSHSSPKDPADRLNIIVPIKKQIITFKNIITSSFH
jgi:hypothetical protein